MTHTLFKSTCHLGFEPLVKMDMFIVKVDKIIKLDYFKNHEMYKM